MFSIKILTTKPIILSEKLLVVCINLNLVNTVHKVENFSIRHCCHIIIYNYVLFMIFYFFKLKIIICTS